jgi:hypothetical protein
MTTATKNDINELKVLITKLSDKINDIETRIPANIIDTLKRLEEQLNSINNSPTADEKERKRSIVITRMPESEKTVSSAKVKDDQQAITSVLEMLGVESPFVCYRMGKSNPTIEGYARPIKLIFPARKFQIEALKAWTKHREEVRDILNSPKFAMRWSESEEERQKKMMERQKTGSGLQTGRGQRNGITVRKQTG